jgi:aryl-alcohol dehydrogenase-like predicted oxidoreductase/enamine deaminase RidA (YjgF/YER057c/UK114 family)
MEFTTLGGSLSVSRIITGLWQVADMEKDGRPLDPGQTAGRLLPYVRSGFSTFDMADHYGSAELIAGELRKGPGGSAVQLLTKWVPPPGPVAARDVREAVRRALDRMKSERIDLLQFHAWRYYDPSWLDALFELNELRKEGVITALGLTNFDAPHLNMMLQSGIPVVSNQVSYSVIDQRAAGAMTETCLHHDVKLLAYGTLAGGYLSERWLGQPEPKAPAGWSQQKYKRFITAGGGWGAFQKLLGGLKAAATSLGCSISQVATKYILDQPAVGAIIIGARPGESDHLEENSKILSLRISTEARQLVRESISTLLPTPGDCGDEYRHPPYLTASGDLSHHFAEAPPPYPSHQGTDGRTKALSGTVWEEIGGFSRAVRKGNRVLVSGTTATHHSHAIGGDDPASQAHFILDKIEGALHSLGASLAQVVRTRIYVRNTEDWEAVARVHGQRFRTIQPANTLVRAELVGNEYLVEMEAEAIVE